MAGRHWLLTSPALPKGHHLLLGRDPVVLGREPGCALRLHSSDVSRRHAQIERRGVSYTIVDLESANGTWVNGRSAARPVTLEHEDLITIGTVQLQFLIVDGERDEIVQRFTPGIEETDHVVKAQPATNAMLAGSFNRDTLHQVCQLIEFHQHAGVLRVESGGCGGFLRFKEGLVVDARFGPALGEKAARTLLGLLSGEYAFYAWKPSQPGAAAPSGSLRLQARAVVMEVLRSEESDLRRHDDEGFLDARPDSDERPPLPKEPPHGAKTQRIPRSRFGPGAP